MIGRLRGTILECSPGEVLLDVGGVGYSVRIPLSTFYSLSASDGREVSLYVHTHVREDALLLFGFSTSAERQAFEALIGIAGVGPRTALAVLSGIGARELENAVRDGDRGRLECIPGIGRKTAERVLLELGDRLEREGRSSRDPGRRAGRRDGGGAPSAPGLRSDAVSALVNLGYARDAAARAVDRSLEEAGNDDATLEAVLKGALRALVR